MTILDERPLGARQFGGRPLDETLPGRYPAPGPAPARRPVRTGSARPPGARPAVAPLHYRGHGIALSRAAHGDVRRRPVSTSVTMALAGLAALTTLWLGALANASGDRAAAPAAAVPDRLAVVSVQAGETLQQLAGRVAPGAPTAAIADRILELNQLDSSALDAGQTLIAPVA